MNNTRSGGQPLLSRGTDRKRGKAAVPLDRTDRSGRPVPRWGAAREVISACWSSQVPRTPARSATATPTPATTSPAATAEPTPHTPHRINKLRLRACWCRKLADRSWPGVSCLGGGHCSRRAGSSAVVLRVLYLVFVRRLGWLVLEVRSDAREHDGALCCCPVRRRHFRSRACGSDLVIRLRVSRSASLTLLAC